MEILQQWAKDHGISQAALDDLAARCVTPFQSFDEIGDGSESRVQSFVKLEGAEHGVMLTRNNVGAGKVLDEVTGNLNFMRWGMMNETKAVNKQYKSGDLVGLKRRLITPQMVGTVIGQFFSRECKRADWKWSGSAHEQGQMNWCNLINAMGGDAKIVSGAGSFD